jgi:hypothetical protein
MQADLDGDRREMEYFKILDNNLSGRIEGNHKKG